MKFGYFRAMQMLGSPCLTKHSEKERKDDERRKHRGHAQSPIVESLERSVTGSNHSLQPLAATQLSFIAQVPEGSWWEVGTWVVSDTTGVWLFDEVLFLQWSVVHQVFYHISYSYRILIAEFCVSSWYFTRSRRLYLVYSRYYTTVEVQILIIKK